MHAGRTISVVIPAFRAEGTIARAVRSALAQTVAPLEIIVVLDGPDPATEAVLQTEFGAALRILRLETWGGASRARNAGVRAAEGEFVAFLDADDEWLPTKLSAQLDAIAHQPGVSLVGCDALLYEPDGSAHRATAVTPPHPGPRAWARLLAQNFIPTPTVLARRSAVLALGGFNEALVVGEDLDLWIRLSHEGGLAYVHDVLVHCYGSDSGLMRSTLGGERRYVLPMIRKHLAQWSDELSASERRRILGNRIFSVAMHELKDGRPGVPAGDFLSAAMLGFRPGTSLYWALRLFVRRLLPDGRTLDPA